MLLAMTAIAVTCLPVTTIEVPAEAPSQRTIEYEEVWRTDPESEEYLIHQPIQMFVDETSNLYVYDRKVGEVLKFDDHGNFVGSIIERGRPGWRPSIAMVLWPPDTIVHWSTTAHQVFRSTTGGVELDELSVFPEAGPGDYSHLTRLVPSGDHAVITAESTVYEGEAFDSETWVGVIDRDGNVLRKLGSKFESRAWQSGQYEVPRVHELDELKHAWAWQEWAASESGSIYNAPLRDQWRVERRTLDGIVDLVLKRDFEPHVRTEEDIAEMNERYGDFARKNGREFKAEWARTDPAINDLEVYDDQLWVRMPVRDANTQTGHRGRYEIFTLDGELIEQVDLVLELAEGQDRFVLLPGGRAVVIENALTIWEEQRARRSGEVLEGEPTKPIIVMYREKR